MKKPTRWLIAFALLFFTIGILFSAAYADENKESKKQTPVKVAPKGQNVPKGTNPQHGQHPGVAHQPGMNRPEHRGAVHRVDHHVERHDFRGHDYRHFSVHEREIWRGGGWRHEWYQGRLGWWWTVGGMWYFFDAPIYPYPEVVPEVVFEAQVDVEQPVEQPAEEPQPPLRIKPQPQQYRYWCDNPRGYYPEVPSCPSGWRQVPVSPPPPPQQ